MILAILFNKEKGIFAYKSKKPFLKKVDVLNYAYANFSEIGKKHSVKVVLSDWENYSKGKIDKYWVFENQWKMYKDKIKIDLFFDKFVYSEESNKLKKKLSQKGILINTFGLEKFCKDKYIHYKQFPELVPQSILVKNINDVKREFDKIKTAKKVLKPRFGHGGKGIKILSKKSEIPNIKSDYILQEWIDTSKGIDKFGVKGIHDIRVVIINGKLIFSFVREAGKGFFANIHQGGKATLIEAPLNIRKKIKKIDKYMKKFGNRFYSADFFYSEGKYYLVELNSKPGFDVAIKFGFEKEEKKLINELFCRVIKNYEKS